jgi:hypothetical protein
MKIGLITYPIERSPAGVGTYTLNLVEHILKLDSKNTYYLLHYAPSTHPIYARNEILYRRLRGLPVMFSDSWHLARHPGGFDVVHRFAPGGFLFSTKCKRVQAVPVQPETENLPGAVLQPEVHLQSGRRRHHFELFKTGDPENLRDRRTKGPCRLSGSGQSLPKPRRRKKPAAVPVWPDRGFYSLCQHHRAAQKPVDAGEGL